MTKAEKHKILIIRLSSIGDVLQCMSTVGGICKKFPNAEIHWIVRSDIAHVLMLDPRIHKVWSFDKKTGFKGLWEITKQLRTEKFNYIYDAHSNIRSNIIKLVLCPFWKRWLGIAPKFTMRSKERLKRFLLFQFRINRFPRPFRGMTSFQKPLEKWNICDFPLTPPSWNFPKKTVSKIHSLVGEKCNQSICLVPSAAWEMKRWPVEHWQELVRLLPQQHFIIIGGPTDDFCQDIADVAPQRCVNLAGKASIMDSCYIVHETALTISADTGFIHAADLFGKKGIFLAGPTAFGFPTGQQIKILEKQMPCRPCTKDGRGKCSQQIYKQCLVDITPKTIAEQVKNLLK